MAQHALRNGYMPRAKRRAVASKTGSGEAVVSLSFDTAVAICAEAARLVGGPRQATHGDKTINFTNIADLWNGWLRLKLRGTGYEADTIHSDFFTAHDVGELMELFKIARRWGNPYNPENYIDAAGYAGCAGEIAAKETTK